MPVRRILFLMVLWTTLVGMAGVESLTPVSSALAQTDSGYRIVGYYASYSIYEDYFVTDILASKITHLNYATIGVSENGQCESSDIWTDTQYSYPGDEPSLRLRGNIRQLQLLRGSFPTIKILMTVGGWDHSQYFSEIAATPQSRARFVRSCVAFMRQYLFDGIDLDWRYPVTGGVTDGRPSDRENLTLLLEEFRMQLDQAGLNDDKTYLLTLLAPASPSLYQNYELERMHIYLDWINLMSFGFQGEWSDTASPHAPLYGNERDPRGAELQQYYNVDAAVNAYLDAGIPANKLVVGIGLYGQAWRNIKPGDYLGLYQPADGVPLGTRPGGMLYYRDMLPLFDNAAYTQFFDEETLSSWLYSAEERIAISYEDTRSVRAKVMYVRQQRLGGIMIWQLNFDTKADPLLESAYTDLTSKLQ